MHSGGAAGARTAGGGSAGITNLHKLPLRAWLVFILAKHPTAPDATLIQLVESYVEGHGLEQYTVGAKRIFVEWAKRHDSAALTEAKTAFFSRRGRLHDRV